MYDANNYGISDDYEYHEITINSRDSTQAFNGTYTNLNWPKIFLGKELENVAALKVLQVVVPKTYYEVNPTNSEIENFHEFTGMYTQRADPVFASGTYTGSELATEVASKLQTASTVYTYAGSYNSKTMKLSLTNNMASANYKFRFGIQTLTQTAAELTNNARDNPRLVLGLQGGVGAGASGFSTNISSNSGTRTLNSYYTCQLICPSLYLNSSIIGSMVNLYLNGSGHMNAPNTGADGPQICSIPVNSSIANGENIIYNDPDPQKWFTFGGDLDFPLMFDFYLTAGVASDQVPLDLNGASFCVKLGVLTNKKTFERTFPQSTFASGRVNKLISAK